MQLSVTSGYTYFFKLRGLVMSTNFNGEGNIGTEPEVKTVSGGNNEPSVVMRMSVHFDNTVKVAEGYEDRGGFWAQVEFWPRSLEEATRLKSIFQVGMRIKVDGNLVQEKWKDKNTNEDRSQMKVRTFTSGLSIALHRIDSVTLSPAKTLSNQQEIPETPLLDTSETGAGENLF